MKFTPDLGTKQEAEPREIMRGSETILLVEDAAPLRDMIRELLEGRGYTVLAAEDGQRAMEIAERHEGNIALLPPCQLLLHGRAAVAFPLDDPHNNSCQTRRHHAERSRFGNR